MLCVSLACPLLEFLAYKGCPLASRGAGGISKLGD